MQKWWNGLGPFGGSAEPMVRHQAVKGLKFAEALPPRLAEATLAARFCDVEGARAVLEEPTEFQVGTAG